MIPRGSLVKKAVIQIGISECTGDWPGNTQYYDAIGTTGSNDRSLFLRALPA